MRPRGIVKTSRWRLAMDYFALGFRELNRAMLGQSMRASIEEAERRLGYRRAEDMPPKLEGRAFAYKHRRVFGTRGDGDNTDGET